MNKTETEKAKDLIQEIVGKIEDTKRKNLRPQAIVVDFDTFHTILNHVDENGTYFIYKDYMQPEPATAHDKMFGLPITKIYSETKFIDVY